MLLLLLLFDAVDGGIVGAVVAVAVAVPPNRADRFATGAFMLGLVLLVMELLGLDDGPFADDDDNNDDGLLLAAGLT